MQHFTCTCLLSDKTLSSISRNKQSNTDKEFFVCDITNSTEREVLVVAGAQERYL